MAVIMPEESTFDRDPSEGDFPSGTYPARLDRVSEVGPSKKFPDAGPRLVFEFVLADGPYAGKKTASFVGKKLWANPKLNKESGLVKLAKQLGCPDPMKGFDPDEYVGKLFNVTCERDATGNPPRSWVRFVTPASAAPPAGGPPPRRGPAAKPAPAFYYVETNPDAEPIEVKDLRAWFAGEGKAFDVHKTLVCPAGGEEWKPAAEYDAGLIF